MIYKQIGTITNKLTKITSDQSPFQLLSITPPSIIKDSENKEQYKKYKATQFVSGEFSEEANQPIIRNNENLYYRDLIIIDIENTGYNSQQAIKLIDSKLQLYKYLLYATINHTEENPRFRLILPPSKKMNEKEYKTTIIYIMNMLNMNFDEHSFVWSQPQGAPVTTESKIKDYIFIKKLEGNNFPVQQAKQEQIYINDDETILISHDISFLNSVINLIYHVENCEVNRYVGDYDEFLRLKELKQRQIEAAYKKQQQEIQELEDFVQRNKARVATRNMAMSRQKKLDKMEKIELVREKPKPEFYFETAPSTSRLIFETEDLVIGYDKPISKPLNLRMERGDRIAIVGANGLGKTTLVNTILGNIKAISGSVSFGQNLAIGYFKQEEHYENNNTPIDEMWEKFPSWEQFKIRAALAKCSLTNVHIESQMKVLSGGEQAKVRLCKILNEKTNILMLDEPTSHLDPESKEELKRALKEYKGGIFLISHEKDFYTDIATEIWNMEDFSLL